MAASSGLEADMVAQVIAQQTLAMAEQTEKKIDAELKALSQLDQNDFEAIRRRRLEEMKARAAKEQQWRQQGHGEYTELRDEKQWFEASRENERMVCHFYRGTTWRCQIVDRHLEALAKKHIETKFCKINAENCPFLAEKLSIVLLPTILMTKDNYACDRIEGFDELGGRDDFTTDQLARRLAKQQIIDYEEPHVNPLAQKKKSVGTKSNPHKKAIFGGLNNRRADASDDDDNEESDDDY